MISTTCYSYLDSPIGEIFLLGDGTCLTGLFLPRHKGRPELHDSWKRSDASFVEARQQLSEYFDGQRQQFDLPMKLDGTPHQLRVWQELTRIPFGTTISYGELARRTGNPSASRAVGNANGRNPISIIVPCHRVIGSSGKLTGYGGGLHNKEWLLEWERRTSSPVQDDLFAALA